MSDTWILLGLAAFGVIATTLGRSYARGQSNLGFVSRRWLAEHNFGLATDSRR